MIGSMARSSLANKKYYRSLLAGNDAVSYGAYELISTAYGTGSSGTITFSSIPQTYKHLQIRAVARTTSTSVQRFYTSLNGDAINANYAVHGLRATQTANSVSSYSFANTLTGFYAGDSGSSTGGYTTDLSAHIIDVLDYAASKNKTIRHLSGLIDNPSSGEHRIGLHSQLWINTSAVSSLSFVMSSGSFSNNTRFSLYGIK